MYSLRALNRLRTIVPMFVRTQVNHSSSTLFIESHSQPHWTRCSPTALNTHNTELRRNYAKGTSKQKEKTRNKGIKATAYTLSDEELANFINLDSYKSRLQKCIETLETEFIKNLSLRSTTGAIETIKVKYESEEHELQDIAQIIRKNPKTIVIHMASFPQMIQQAVQAIAKSGMNLNPQQDGTTLYIPVPKVTKDHRIQLAKNAKALYNTCRDHIRDVQNDILRKLKRNSDITEDDSHSANAKVVAIAAEYTAQAEKMFHTKEKELLGN